MAVWEAHPMGKLLYQYCYLILLIPLFLILRGLVSGGFGGTPHG